MAALAAILPKKVRSNIRNRPRRRTCVGLAKRAARDPSERATRCSADDGLVLTTPARCPPQRNKDKQTKKEKERHFAEQQRFLRGAPPSLHLLT